MPNAQRMNSPADEHQQHDQRPHRVGRLPASIGTATSSSVGPPSECATGAPARTPGCYWPVTALDSGGMPFPSSPEDRDRPWVMRTYAGHSSPAESNALYRRNLAKGQTGLSVAFDLPTQTGYDPDDELAARRGRQGRRPGHLTSATCARCSTASRSTR